MSAALETAGKKKVNVSYVNSGVPLSVKETVEGYYIEHGDLSLEEVLQDQEIVYQSFQTNGRSAKVSIRSGTIPGANPASDCRRNVEKEGESSQSNRVVSQLASDEAYARALQELEDQLSGSSVGESTRPAISPSPSTATRELNSTNRNSVVRRQDSINPDNMTYEELRSLGETIGTESKGLPEELISYLPSSKYKTGHFSRKDKHEECVICYMQYKNRETIITLPCQHHYHSHCVTRWLKINKACPVCNEEVFGS